MDRLLSMQVFERVADTGGFAAAARALALSPPVVTRLVAELEKHLGTRLFQRTTRRVSLTEAGAAYLSHVRRILQDVQEAEAVASAHTNELAGQLRVYTQPVLATYVIAPLLSGFHRLYPSIQVDIEVNDYKQPLIEDFDITLLGTDAGFDANIIARKVIESEVVLVASPAYIERRGHPQQPEDLLQHECLRLKHPNGTLRPWRVWRKERPEEAFNVEITPVIAANHTDTLLRAALDGAGITSVSIDIVASYLSRGELSRVLSPWITGRLGMYAVLPSRKFIPRRSKIFLDYMTQETRARNIKALAACDI
jgi:DNA-binding transcriptional LysR family regulator